jgi:hypothetical protein
LINASKPADVITVNEYLQNQGKADEMGGLGYLNSLAQYVPSASNIRRYAEIVRERSILRKLVSASDEIATNAFNPQGKAIDRILDEAEQCQGHGRRDPLTEAAHLAGGLVVEAQHRLPEPEGSSGLCQLSRVSEPFLPDQLSPCLRDQVPLNESAVLEPRDAVQVEGVGDLRPVTRGAPHSARGLPSLGKGATLPLIVRKPSGSVFGAVFEPSLDRRCLLDVLAVVKGAQIGRQRQPLPGQVTHEP